VLGFELLEGIMAWLWLFRSMLSSKPPMVVCGVILSLTDLSFRNIFLPSLMHVINGGSTITTLYNFINA